MKKVIACLVLLLCSANTFATLVGGTGTPDQSSISLELFDWLLAWWPF